MSNIATQEAALWQDFRRVFNQSRLPQPILDPAVNRAYEAWYATAYDTAAASNVIPFCRPGTRA